MGSVDGVSCLKNDKPLPSLFFKWVSGFYRVKPVLSKVLLFHSVYNRYLPPQQYIPHLMHLCNTGVCRILCAIDLNGLFFFIMTKFLFNVQVCQYLATYVYQANILTLLYIL